MSSQSMTCWVAQWYSRGEINGVKRHLIGLGVGNGGQGPKLFRTRVECEHWIGAAYGYIKTRKDLRNEPHGWRMPRPVQVTVTYQWSPR